MLGVDFRAVSGSSAPSATEGCLHIVPDIFWCETSVSNPSGPSPLHADLIASHRSPFFPVSMHEEKMKSNFGKTMYYPEPVATVHRTLRKLFSTQKTSQYSARERNQL